ncbi:MAG TPA: phytanoyl-CoA dioxygenase family protein [Terriglobales bacterium]|nr:phytanoyl-CoA dioxygenase family protein [Terriglobales bacterium]
MPGISPEISEAIEKDGYAVIESVADSQTVAALMDATASPELANVRQRNRRQYAVRNLLAIPAVRNWSQSPAVRAIVEPILSPSARPVRGILFDKTDGANWKVAWHQDLSIAVQRRIDVQGFGPWSTKAGVVHVQPPVDVLRRMLTLRLHLDDCGEDNGPLKVLPGSHAQGVLSDDAIRRCRQETAPASCCGAAGSVVVMRPLILHASSAADRPGHRRVVHIEFAAAELPGGLEWDQPAEQKVT